MGVQQAAGEKYVEGVALAYQVNQSSHLPVTDGYSQPRHRNAQPAALAGYAEVGGDRQFAAPSGGEPLDHRNGWGGHLGRGLQQPIHRLVVAPALDRVRPVSFEVGDVGASGKRLAARSGDDDGPDRRVGVQVPEQPGHGAPHIEAQGVALAGTVDGDRGQRRLAVDENVAAK